MQNIAARHFVAGLPQRAGNNITFFLTPISQSPMLSKVHLV
jgi:hypothetical protein